MSPDSAPADAYPVSARNKVKRVHERARYDRAGVHAILDAGMLCHVAYVIEGQPYCTPTLHWREGDTLYWHGSSASRMLRHLKPGTRACLTVSHLDGLVLARSGFHHSVNYRSAMCFGMAHIVDDPDEKARALLELVDRFYPGRAGEVRQTTPQEAKGTMVMRMHIEEASAKVRAAGVNDDEEDYGHPVWAGVIPVHTIVGVPEPCPRLAASVLPSQSLSGYVTGRKFDEALLEAQQRYENGE